MREVRFRSGQRLIPVVGLILTLPLGAHAQVVVPNANLTTEGTAGLNTLIRSAPRTLQMVISASELSGVSVGGTITGLAFRLDNSFLQASQPTFPITFIDYDIYVGAAGVTPSGASTTLLSNYVSPASKTKVRGGALTLGTGFFPKNAIAPLPNSFSADIGFNLGAYTYTGGNLIIEITHSGNAATDFSLDATPNSATARALGAAVYNASSADSAFVSELVPVVRLSTLGAAPEPGVLGLLALGGIALLVRRRR